MRDIKFKVVMQRLDGVIYVSEAYGMGCSFLPYLFDIEDNRWDKFLETITTEQKFIKLFPDEDEDLKGWSHIENIQYTGLKDINKEEIYEGDYMLDGHSGSYGEVKFYNGAFVIEFDNEIQDLFDWTDECIIGNIFETKLISN